MTKTEKDCIVNTVRAAVGNADDGGGLCLHLSMALLRELARHNIRGVLQAGSAQWKCMAIDDGVSPTHFAYMWELSTQTKTRIDAGLLPEMHCWIGIPSTQEIVDIATNQLVEQARLRAGIKWTADPPPDYIWSGAEDFPAEARYMVNPVATAVAMWFANKAGL